MKQRFNIACYCSNAVSLTIIKQHPPQCLWTVREVPIKKEKLFLRLMYLRSQRLKAWSGRKFLDRYFKEKFEWLIKPIHTSIEFLFQNSSKRLTISLSWENSTSADFVFPLRRFANCQRRQLVKPLRALAERHYFLFSSFLTSKASALTEVKQMCTLPSFCHFASVTIQGLATTRRVKGIQQSPPVGAIFPAFYETLKLFQIL